MYACRLRIQFCKYYMYNVNHVPRALGLQFGVGADRVVTYREEKTSTTRDIMIIIDCLLAIIVGLLC